MYRVCFNFCVFYRSVAIHESFILRKFRPDGQHLCDYVTNCEKSANHKTGNSRKIKNIQYYIQFTKYRSVPMYLEPCTIYSSYSATQYLPPCTTYSLQVQHSTYVPPCTTYYYSSYSTTVQVHSRYLCCGTFPCESDSI